MPSSVEWIVDSPLEREDRTSDEDWNDPAVARADEPREPWLLLDAELLPDECPPEE